MVDETKLRRDAERGRKADALLKDELLSGAFKALELQYVQAWAATEAAESGARENYWRAVQILGDVRKHLAAVAASGRVASVELDRLGGLNRLRD